MRKTKRVAMLALAASLFVVAACGDGEAEPASTEPASTEPASTEPVSTEPVSTEPAASEIPATGDFSVGLVYDIGGRGDQSFNDSAFAGIDRAATELGITYTEASPNEDGSNRAELLQLAADSNDMVIAVGFLFEADAAAVGTANAGVNFGVVDSSMLDFALDPPAPYGTNIAGLVFAEEQGSYLVGAAAALKSTTGKIGFIGGVSGLGLIEKFEAGYIAGAKSINPDIEIVPEYISAVPDFAGFNAPDRARDIALAMYESGADIVYHAAGGSGAGLFEAAKTHSDSSGSKVWAIGVDSDQYNTVDPAVQEFVLTSMLKRVDVAVYEIIKAQINGTFAAGPKTYDLSVDGVGYSTSGGFIDDIAAQLEEIKAEIVSGAITVPTDPTKA